MMVYQYIKHANVDNQTVSNICAIKDESWSHGQDKQREWLLSNLSPEDIHLLGQGKNELLAYMNLVHRTFIVGDNEYPIIGIGNVCVRASLKGIGVGSKLMEEINRYIVENRQRALLLCKNHLVDFYSKNAWSLVPKNGLRASFDISTINIMQYNFPIASHSNSEMILKGNPF